jgi:hypothetical protein
MRIANIPIILCSAIFFFNAGECGTSDWNKAPDCVIQASSQGLAGYLEKIPPEEATRYGFSSADALTESITNPVFGSPLQLLNITPNALESYVEGMTVTELLSDMMLWYVPVLERQRIVAFLVVEQSEKFPCQAVSFGYARLAMDYETTLSQVGQNRMDQAVLVVVLQAREHFIAFPDDEPANLYSVRAQVTLRERTVEPENTLNSTVKRLKSMVRDNLQQQEGF